MKVKQWFNWHSLTGVWTGLLLFIICWSGTFATLSHEFDWLTNNAVRAASTDEEPVSLAQAYEIVRQAKPDDKISFASAPIASGFNYVVVVETAQGQWRHVYVDPASGQIKGDSSYFTIQRFFRDFHRNLFGAVNRTFASYLVFLLAIPLLISIISALYLYRGWWRKFFTLSWGQQRRANVASIHKLAGVWSLWFSLLIALTSVWYLYEAFRADAIDGKVTYTGAGRYAVQQLPEITAADQPALSLSQLLANAQQVRPELDIRSIWFDNGYLQVTGQAGHLLVRDRANKVYLNASDGQIVHDQNASDLSLYWRLSDTADPLHFGDFGGLISKIIWFIFGLLLSFLSLSGSYMYLKRQFAKRQQLKYRKTLLVSLGGSVLMLISSVWAGYRAMLSYGSNGQWPDMPLATISFLLGWTLLTLLIVSYWFYRLLTLYQRN
ncbi:PepSY-associated TM helix domain-containing protein [Arsukibacterium perlucidum]|uniref:PepSY-associated TM helix domain-containing protein n=1 Tax=Arsukibacterium perlucidum TaxID=368811 RepID=UPI00037B69A2|nr:PepSY-associated TM helix domain-containing protein [Arsukibacterium perlucidum]